MKKRFYSAEFKQNTIDLRYKHLNIKELDTELDMNVQRIYKWRKRALEAKSPSSQNKQEDVVSRSKHKKIQKQLKDKELELEILKKAIHIFSKKDGSTTNL